jgi:hypothetical protein
MREQRVNTATLKQSNPLFQWLSFLFVAFFILTLSGCVPSGEQDVNTELFKSKEDLSERAAALKPGMSKKSVFEKLAISPDKFEIMSAQNVQMCIYGNAQVQGSPEQLEQFKKRILSYAGYSLPYREIKSSSSLGFGKMKVEKTGYDLRLVLIFEGNKLLKSTVEGTLAVKQQEDQYLWESLIRRGIGFAF